jgi:hypothetical protein
MKNKYSILERNGHYEIIFGSNTTVLYGGRLESVKVKEIAKFKIIKIGLQIKIIINPTIISLKM